MARIAQGQGLAGLRFGFRRRRALRWAVSLWDFLALVAYSFRLDAEAVVSRRSSAKGRCVAGVSSQDVQ